MNAIQRITKNTTVLLFAQIVSAVLGFIYMVYAARYLGVAGFGVLSFALAFTSIFGVCTDFGLQPYTIREVAREKRLASKYLANISLMKVVMSVVTFGLIAITIKLMGYPEQTVRVVYLLAVFIILNAFILMFYSVFHAYERMEYESLGQLLRSALIFAGVMLAVTYGFSVIGFAAMYCIAGFIVLIYCFIILRWKISDPPVPWSPRKLEIDGSFWKATLKKSLPFGLTIVFATVYYWVDSVMLSFMKGDAVVGWYNVSYRLVFTIQFIPNAFAAAIFPIMSNIYKTSLHTLRLYHEEFLKYMAILGVPIGVGVTFLASRFILLIFGAEYTNSILALQILVWSAAFYFMSHTYAVLFATLNKQEIPTKIIGACVILNIFLNLILIPRYSLIGASIATVVTQFMVLALNAVWSYRIGYGIAGKKLTGIISRVMVASAVMGALLALAHALNLIILVVGSILLYFIVLYSIRGVKKEDISFIKTAIRR